MYDWLDKNNLHRINEAALELLEKVGVKIEHEKIKRSSSLLPYRGLRRR